LASQLVKDLIDSGIHFGHRASRWNPKMEPYIYGKRNLIHIIDIKETVKGILLAKKFLARTVAEGKEVMLVGTKRQARKAIAEHAERVGMHWVNDRWLGGTLTNFREIRKRVGRLEELERMEAEGQLDAYSKKAGASLRREMRKIRRNLGGFRKMEKLPGALVVIDVRREIIAVREARKMHIPVVALLDTDCDPDMVDIPIPGNDDAMRSIDLVVRALTDAIEEGLRGRAEQAQQPDQVQAPRRRSRRATTARADESGDSGVAVPDDGSAEPVPERNAASEPTHQRTAAGAPPAQDAPAQDPPQQKAAADGPPTSQP
jgi:small subunit ribosomal protein S2